MFEYHFAKINSPIEADEWSFFGCVPEHLMQHFSNPAEQHSRECLGFRTPDKHRTSPKQLPELTSSGYSL